MSVFRFRVFSIEGRERSGLDGRVAVDGGESDLGCSVIFVLLIVRVGGSEAVKGEMGCCRRQFLLFRIELGVWLGKEASGVNIMPPL